MNTPPDPPDRRSPFEWSLAALRPADTDMARPSFMFKAGQASRQKVVWFWRCIAGGLGVVIVVGGLAVSGWIQAEQQRAEAMVAEARASQALATRPAIVTEPTPDPTPAPIPSPTLITTRPTFPRPVAVSEEVSPSEVAAALERRRNILVGGLGLIPDSPPVYRPDVPGTAPTYPGVFAAPRVEKSPPPPVSDPDNPR